MSLLNSHDRGFRNDVHSSFEMIRNLANSVLEAKLVDDGDVNRLNEEERVVLKGYLQRIFTHASHVFGLLNDTATSTAIVRAEKPVTTEYRLTEEGNHNAVSETSLVVTRPSLLQLATDAVPAIDLENRQHLMHAIVEILRQDEEGVTHSSSTALQPSRHPLMPVVTIVDQPVIADPNTLKYLFQPKKMLTTKQSLSSDK